MRFHKFTIGYAWMSEYGNPETEKDFLNLIRLSPLHNVPDAQTINRFPSVLLLTGVYIKIMHCFFICSIIVIVYNLFYTHLSSRS